MAEGISLHQKGRLAQAQAIYDRVLGKDASHFDALHLSGVIAYQTGRAENAVELIGKAIRVNPGVAAAYCNRGSALLDLGQFDAAVSDYRKAIDLNRDYAEAHNNLATACIRRRRFDEGLACADRAIRIKPGLAEAHDNRGQALHELGRIAQALESYERAIAINPGLAGAYNNRGNSLLEAGKPEAALASFDTAIGIQPDFAEAHSNRGNALRALGQPEAALASCERAIAIKPRYAVAHNNRGIALRELHRLDAAIASFDRAIEIDPAYAEAFGNRGNALTDLKQIDAALASYDGAIRLDPDDAKSQWNRSLALLLAGDLEAGWPSYEWRWKRKEPAQHQRRFAQPLWLGEPSLSGKTILLHSEQGLGDALQFCRYAKPVHAMGAHVVLEVPRSLAAVLRGLEGVGEIIHRGSPPPPFDYHCPLLALPLALRTNLATIPRADRYLHADPAALAKWSARLGTASAPRIGLVWSGSTIHTNDRNRSIPLAGLLLHLPPGFEYVSLQKEVRPADAKVLASHPAIRHFGDALEDFADTAALCELMDLVVSVDTSVAHLAAALGRPTWILLPFAPDWRWLLEREDSPWYESVRLYRQGADWNWEPVLRRIAGDISKIAGGAI